MGEVFVMKKYNLKIMASVYVFQYTLANPQQKRKDMIHNEKNRFKRSL